LTSTLSIISLAARIFDGDVAQPFIALTFGMSRFDPQPAEFSAEKFFSASVGGGVQLNPGGRFGVRLEGRVYTSLVDDNSRSFCGSDGEVGGCLIEIDGTLLTQWEATAGIVFRKCHWFTGAACRDLKGEELVSLKCAD
jgi:hypothetical protein